VALTGLYHTDYNVAMVQPKSEETMMKEFAWSIALYTEVKRKTLTLLETFEMWIWSRLVKVSWTEH